MPRVVNDLLSRPWAIGLLIVGAFVLPLLLTDLFGSGQPPRRIALVTPMRTSDEQPAPTPAIPDLRPARALPLLRTTETAPAAAATPAAEPAPNATTASAPASAAPAPAAVPASTASPSGGGSSTDTSGSFQNSGSGSGQFEDSN